MKILFGSIAALAMSLALSAQEHNGGSPTAGENGAKPEDNSILRVTSAILTRYESRKDSTGNASHSEPGATAFSLSVPHGGKYGR
jgi:hypothetical protein